MFFCSLVFLSTKMIQNKTGQNKTGQKGQTKKAGQNLAALSLKTTCGAKAPAAIPRHTG
jgi:hypothetical protein